MSAEVMVRREGAVGLLSLNRPQAIHSLTLGMVHAMTAALLEWRDDPAVQAVILDHAEGRGFCAGGDIAELRESIVNDALQLFGGYGYLKDYPIERFWRDLRVHSILEGTNQVMRMIVGRDLLRQ